jgi:hypothetical protein
MKRISEEKIREHRQALYAPLDGRPASNDQWLKELFEALEAERVYSSALEKRLRELGEDV